MTKIVAREAKEKFVTKNCFVICPIGPERSNERKHSDLVFNYIIIPALRPLGYNIWRSDVDSSPDLITSKIIDDIEKADLCVADLTGLNPNVFYEVGIRHRAGKHCIHIAQEGTILPFDVSGMNTIFFDILSYESHVRAAESLGNFAQKVSSRKLGPINPVTNAVRLHEAIEKGDQSAQEVERLRSEKRALELENERLKKDNRFSPQVGGLTVFSSRPDSFIPTERSYLASEVFTNLLSEAVKKSRNSSEEK